MIDRTVAPKIELIDSFNLIEGEKESLENGLEIYSIDCSEEELVKIDWLFIAGSYDASKPMISNFTNLLLLEGTKSKTAKEVSELLDFYGATLHPSSDADKSSLTLYCLNKHLEKVLPLVKEIIEEPVFNIDELELLRTKKVNQLKLNLQKGDYVAKNLMDQSLFGQSHPYGYFLQLEDIKEVKQSDLIEFHHKYYHYNNCKIIVSGMITSQIKAFFPLLFGSDQERKVVPKTKRISFSSEEKVVRYKMKNSVQGAICLGKKALSKMHPEYVEMLVVDTIFGGYFGSRLMNNIREDKGYTYGIYSAVVPYLNESYQYIATEVDKNVVEETLIEIKKEIERLHTELVCNDELEVVRNYLVGSFLTSIDGPFALSSRLRSILLYNLGYDYYYNFLDVVKTITPERIRELAQKHMRLEDYYEVVAV